MEREVLDYNFNTYIYLCHKKIKKIKRIWKLQKLKILLKMPHQKLLFLRTLTESLIKEIKEEAREGELGNVVEKEMKEEEEEMIASQKSFKKSYWLLIELPG